MCRIGSLLLLQGLKGSMSVFCPSVCSVLSVAGIDLESGAYIITGIIIGVRRGYFVTQRIVLLVLIISPWP